MAPPAPDPSGRRQYQVFRPDVIVAKSLRLLFGLAQSPLSCRIPGHIPSFSPRRDRR